METQSSASTNAAAVRSFKMADNIQTLRASLKEYEKNIIRHLTNPVYIFFIDLYEACRADVRDGKVPQIEGRFADLRWFQEKLREIPKWNTDQIKTETAKIIGRRPAWQFTEILKTVFYIKSMILASIRPTDMHDEVYISIPTPEVYLHRVLSVCAERLFANPAIISRYKHDDAETVAHNREIVNSYIIDSIVNAIIDLVPADEIVNKYVSQALNSIKAEQRHEAVKDDDMSKYGFEDRPKQDDDMSEEEEEEESEYSDASVTGSDVSGSEYDDEETGDEDEEYHSSRHHHQARLHDKRPVKRSRHTSRSRSPVRPQTPTKLPSPTRDDIKEIPKLKRIPPPIPPPTVPDPHVRPRSDSLEDGEIKRPERPERCRSERGSHMPRTSRPHRR